MKNLLTAIVGVLCLTLFSCQKEVDDIFKSNGNTGSIGSKLVQIGTRTGSDSITTNLSYNSSNRLSDISYSGTVIGQPINAEVIILRNSSNIITSTISKSSIYPSIGLDSVVVKYNYDGANSRYRYSVASYNLSGVLTQDSTIYNYSVDGKLVNAIGYHNDGTGYAPDTEDSLLYNGNNIASSKSYSYNGSSFDLDQTVNYEQYDNKINPLQFATDAPVLGMTTFYSANNVTKRTIIDYSSGSTATGNFTYSYNNSNKPMQAISTDGSQTSVSTYYYQ